MGSQDRVVFIGGAMRSGTTVIHRVLCTGKNTNPYISESWFLSDIMRLYHWNMQRYDVRHADQFGSRSNFRDLIWNNVRQYITLVSVKYNDPEVLMLKHPELTYHFPELAAVFDNFRFIVIVRDPRDVISSIKKVAEKHNESHLISPQTVLDSTKKMCNSYLSYYKPVLSSRNLAKKVLFLKYEDFVTDPAAQLEKVGSFTGAQYDFEKAAHFLPEHAEAWNFNKEKRLDDPFSGAFWSDLYTQTLSKSRIGTHKDVLSEEERQEIETVLKPFANRFQYW